MIEYVIAAGGNITGLVDNVTMNPWAVGGGVALLLLIYLFTIKG